MIKEKVIVFGRGDYYSKKKEDLLEKFEIIAFLDNSVEDYEYDGQSGIPVYNPVNINELPDVYIFCVAADFISMWKQLISLDVRDERIRFGAEISPLQEGVETIAFSHAERLYSREKKLYYESAEFGIKEITGLEDLKEMARRRLKKDNADISRINKLATTPTSNVFGSDRGKAVDREYIEEFLRENSDDVKGIVLEVLNNYYTRLFGGDRVEKSVVSHVKGWGRNTILCNFETGEGVVADTYDCIICTQTLQYIFDVRKALKNIYTMLKPGGCALITVPGIKPLCEYDDSNWGEYWSFTAKSIQRLLSEICDAEDFTVKIYGNVKTATAYLYGICAEELDASDFRKNDPRYPFIITARLHKRD